MLEASPSFYMAQSINDRGEPSVGLGFALSQLIISMHGGSLTVKSTPDRKVQVTALFPLSRVVGKNA
jgi:K+-sensing histidine kinase KdpD